MPATTPSDVAFSPTVKAIQRQKGSRRAYARQEELGGWPDRMDSGIAAFVSAQTSMFLGTANAEGQPYIQHRGGPPGFLNVIDPKTIGFADFSGNRQYITLGNLADNPKAFLFLIDYAHSRRVKIWGKARMIEDDEPLVRRLMPGGYKARPERALLFDVEALDINCPQHIPQRFEAADVAAALAARDRKIAELEAELAELRLSRTPDG